MANSRLNAATQKKIQKVLDFYEAEQDRLKLFLGQLRECIINSQELMSVIHSVKWRIKEPSHLKNKLERKALQAIAQGGTFDITSDNLFQRITDLVGMRVLYLYTAQFPNLHSKLIQNLDMCNYELLENFVRSWDDETKKLFEGWGISVQESESMYTSVHYVLRANMKTPYTCEIQVRTLMEEVWGEVNHSINYPVPSDSIACTEQLKALARLTSGCTRLVDSIYRSNEEYDELIN